MAGWKNLFSRKQTEVQENNSDACEIPKLFDVVFTSDTKLFSLCKVNNPNQNRNSVSIPVLPCTKGQWGLSAAAIETEKRKIQNSLESAAQQRHKSVVWSSHDKVAQGVDESVFLHISSDKMLAWLMLFPPLGNGKQLTSSQILQNLINQGVTYGIDYDFLYSLSTQQNRYFCLYAVACGKSPVEAQDGRVVELYPRDVDLKTKYCELSHVDYAWLNLRRKVQEGDVICEIIPPTPGISGITVTRNLFLPTKSA